MVHKKCKYCEKRLATPTGFCENCNRLGKEFREEVNEAQEQAKIDRW